MATDKLNLNLAFCISMMIILALSSLYFYNLAENKAEERDLWKKQYFELCDLCVTTIAIEYSSDLIEDCDDIRFVDSYSNILSDCEVLNITYNGTLLYCDDFS